MIRKFVMVLGLTLLIGHKGYAQNAPSAQTPATQQPAGQQPTAQPPADDQSSSTDEVLGRKKVRPHDYRKWTFNIGAGANLPSGTTRTFVKGGGIDGMAGVARNANRYLGLRLDFIWADLPLRTSALQLAQAPSGTNHVYGVMLDPILNIPVTKKYTIYMLVGPSYFHRSGKLDSSTVVPGSACNAFWDWWGTCFNGSVPLNKDFLSSHQNEFGVNVGGGLSRKVWGNVEIYGEARYFHAKHNNITTDTRPITVGIRW